MSEYILAELDAAQTAGIGALQTETNASIQLAESIIDEFSAFEEVNLAADTESVFNLDLAAAEIGLEETAATSLLLGPAALLGLSTEVIGAIVAEQFYLDNLDIEGVYSPFIDTNPGGIYDYKPPVHYSENQSLNRNVQNRPNLSFELPLRQRVKKTWSMEGEMFNEATKGSVSTMPVSLAPHQGPLYPHPVAKGNPVPYYPVDYRRDVKSHTRRFRRHHQL